MQSNRLPKSVAKLSSKRASKKVIIPASKQKSTKSKSTTPASEKAPIPTFICNKNNEAHVGKNDEIAKIKKYIKDNISWYISSLNNDDIKESLFNENDEGLLKYIKLIINDVSEIDEINKLLISILDAIQVDQAHDFLDGSSRTKDKDASPGSLNKNLKICLASNVEAHSKIIEYLNEFNSDDTSNDVKDLSLDNNNMPDVRFSITDTGVRDDKSKEIVGRTKQVVALASIIDSAGCRQKNRNMCPKFTDELELIITNIGYIFYQSFYRWFRENSIVTLIFIDAQGIKKLIDGCDKTYSIKFYKFDNGSKMNKLFYIQKGVIAGCNGDFTVNKIVTTLFKTPQKCCNELFDGLSKEFSNDLTIMNNIIMTYYVLNKGFGDFSQMFSCLYFNNRISYDLTEPKEQNIHYKNIILCTVDRFLAYICHLCKCPFLLGASATCRYYSCDTNAKYYDLSVIDAYNKFNDLKIIKYIISHNHPTDSSSDSEEKISHTKEEISDKYYKDHIILIEVDVDKVLSSTTNSTITLYKVNEEPPFKNLCSLSIEYNLSNVDIFKQDNFNTLKSNYYDILQNNGLITIAESEIFSQFILKKYNIEITQISEISKIPSSSRRSLSQRPIDKSRYKDIQPFLTEYPKKIIPDVKKLGLLISELEDIKNNIRLLENHFKKLYKIINENNNNTELLSYINQIIKDLKKCIDLLVIKQQYINYHNNISLHIADIKSRYTDNSNFYDMETQSFGRLELKLEEEEADFTKEYNAFILPFNTLEFIEKKFNSLKFKDAIEDVNIAYCIAYGMIRLNSNIVEPKSTKSGDEIYNVANVKKYGKIWKSKTLKDGKQKIENDKKIQKISEKLIAVEDIQRFNIDFEEKIVRRDNAEAEQENEDFKNNIEPSEYKCDYDCEKSCTSTIDDEMKTGGNIKENKILNRYNKRIILIKYNIKKLMKNNNYNNVEKMQNKIKDIKIKIKNIKEKDKKNKSKQQKTIKETKVKNPKPVKDTKHKKSKLVKDTKHKKPKPVKDTKDKKPKPIKDTNDKKPKPVKDTKDKKPKTYKRY